MPGRTDNEIKNYWRTHFKKKDKSSRNNKKQEKRRAKILKHMKHQEQQQQPQDHHQHDATKTTISSHAHHSNTETNLCETTVPQDNNYSMELEQYMCEDQYLPIPPLWPEEEDEGLWVTLWNLEETAQVGDGDQGKQYCSKCGMQNIQHTTCCFHDFSNNLCYANYMFG